MPFPDIDPVLIQIGPFAIRWYALAYIAGLVLGWRYVVALAQTPRIWPGAAPVTKLDVDDALLWAALGVILGGRLGYVLVYNPAYFASHPLEIFYVWQGGMSFHGGAFGVLVAILFFARSRGIPPLSMMDLASAAAPIGLFFGRIANFINAELWGRVTDAPWGVIFPTGGPLPRHPSQLYEAALEGIALFLLLRLLTHNLGALKKPGMTTGIFIAGYGAARTTVEFFREPDQQIGYLFGDWLTMGMLLSVPMVLVGAGLAVYCARREVKPAAAMKRK
ncbi:prolipoprotein diacylglyceryl transferase [Parvibaculum sp.]|uniref:prolipoprotein diacylglyceryl transferase n=1 Tax=Parvibaculum sp. TaxID=2024848 RepID=UPI00272F0250|nr:prolipoprotein diacylglyceryl transferase [Parvibaculum sp.]MDP1628968.1 prolipoprotein diacylglyceryl transferase [Parvibaculum sp.]MDP2148355.1 prolipoprotein diacylglyceryl transferase [Parvibaculum sp.]MDP3329643.1 prolipoprotein diacylglyceryl transferase [Parvibaculum sp.]